MNEIEKKFFNAMIDELFDPDCRDYEMCEEDGYIEVHHTPSAYNRMIEAVKPQAPIEIYFADFLIETCWNPFCYIPDYIVEIDGHDYHKTKQQRHEDYERERFLLKRGYKVIRFTGSEVYVDAQRCANETIRIIENDFLLITDYYLKYRADYLDYISASIFNRETKEEIVDFLKSQRTFEIPKHSSMYDK